MPEVRARVEASNRLAEVVVFAGLFEPGYKGGGPVRSLVRFMDTLPPTASVRLVTRDRDLGSDAPYDGIPTGTWRPRGAAQVFYLDVGSLRHWGRLVRHLLAQRDTDVLYVNSMWDRFFSIVPLFLARLRVIRPRLVLVAPRGEFSTGALGLKSGRKRAFLGLWRRMVRPLPLVWHASTEREAADVRALFPDATIEVVLDQTSLPLEGSVAPQPHAGALRLVFVSRISPMKNLAEVLAGLRDVEQPVELDLYGPCEDLDYWARCEELIGGLPAHVSVQYRGSLEPDQVPATFAGYDAFVFPTLGENFGHVIAESLSAGCPVICPDTTPWTPVISGGGGLVLDSATAPAVAAAVARLASLTPAARATMRQQAADAFTAWRSAHPDVNVLAQVLERYEGP